MNDKIKTQTIIHLKAFEVLKTRQYFSCAGLACSVFTLVIQGQQESLLAGSRKRAG